MWTLHNGPLRFSEIKALLPYCSVKVLSQLLKEMERNGLIIRTVYPTTPVKVIYSLHEDLQPMIILKANYNKFLCSYFLNRSNDFNIPSDIITRMQEELSTD